MRRGSPTAGRIPIHEDSGFWRERHAEYSTERGVTLHQRRHHNLDVEGLDAPQVRHTPFGQDSPGTPVRHPRPEADQELVRGKLLSSERGILARIQVLGGGRLHRGVEVGFQTVGELYTACKFRAALTREANSYTVATLSAGQDRKAPWFQIKEDPQAAATAVYVILRAIGTWTPGQAMPARPSQASSSGPLVTGRNPLPRRHRRDHLVFRRTDHLDEERIAVAQGIS